MVPRPSSLNPLTYPRPGSAGASASSRGPRHGKGGRGLPRRGSCGRSWPRAASDLSKNVLLKKDFLAVCVNSVNCDMYFFQGFPFFSQCLDSMADSQRVVEVYDTSHLKKDNFVDTVRN